MDFFGLANKRRSVRKFTDDPIPEEVMRKTLDVSLLAANSSNLQPWEMDSYNAQIENLDANSAFALQGLMARMQNQEGSPPALMQGQPSQYSAPKYDSLNQLTVAMSDPRYASDPAFRREVASRLNNSALF